MTLAFRGQRGVWVDTADQVDGQTFWLFPGLRLVGCATEWGTSNGQLYTVVSFGETSVAPHVLDSDQGAEPPRDAAWVKCRKPVHTLCYYAA